MSVARREMMADADSVALPATTIADAISMATHVLVEVEETLVVRASFSLNKSTTLSSTLLTMINSLMMVTILHSNRMRAYACKSVRTLLYVTALGVRWLINSQPLSRTSSRRTMVYLCRDTLADTMA